MEPNFRDEHRRIVAALVRKFGSSHLETILDSAQDAFVAALQTWPIHGTPEYPTAWLIRTAERRVIDHLRRGQRETQLDDQARHDDPATSELTLYLMACSPRLTVREQVCLVLRTLAGLTAAEIAHLLHESEEAVQRRISRAKDKLVPDDVSLDRQAEKLSTVHLVLYLVFTEGYEASRGEQYLRADLALSALRLAEELATVAPSAELDALLALMYFHISRLPARVGAGGEPVLMPDQDRSNYNSAAIRRGFAHLERAQQADVLTRYHLEAGLAAAIVAGADSGEVLTWHELLIAHFPTPLARVSWALAVGNHRGWEAGQRALESLVGDPLLDRSAHFIGALGYAAAQLGQTEIAVDFYRRAIALGMSAPARRSFERRIAEFTGQAS
jgi:RNA polymerase sigma factor (sigma-70 family)